MTPPPSSGNLAFFTAENTQYFATILMEEDETEEDGLPLGAEA